jgi:hypothetical protein
MSTTSRQDYMADVAVGGVEGFSGGKLAAYGWWSCRKAKEGHGYRFGRLR